LCVSRCGQETAPPEKNKKSPAARFPIVGIGASAGGPALERQSEKR
jgi:chemotaxis response regulator CheB